MITNETLIMINVGTLITAGGIYTRMIYMWARLELTQQFHKEQMNQAFTKIRELEKVVHNLRG